ncbi:MAG: molybdenum cofactor biosynthesis protein B [Christensenellales bacterium]
MRKVCIIVVNDLCFRGEREDRSGEVIKKILLRNGYTIEGKIVVPNEKEMIEEAIKHCCDNLKAPLVLTTGGTGFARRDVTPEATKNCLEREAMGIVEAIRTYSLEFTDKAMLSRAVSGIRGDSLVINLPGSEKAVKEALDVILGAVSYGLDVLSEN